MIQLHQVAQSRQWWQPLLASCQRSCWSASVILIAALFGPIAVGDQLSVSPPNNDATMRSVAVIGDNDERLFGARPFARQQLGDIADIYLGRALRVWFPTPGSLEATATPVCFPDVVVTVAHIYANIGDNSAEPLGLRISVPDLDRPGKFRETLSVRDFQASTKGRNYDPNSLPVVRDDFLVLSLNKDLPADVVPLGLLPYEDIRSLTAPVQCERATVNAAYHADLGLLGNAVVSIDVDPGAGRITAPGQTPLVTVSAQMSDKVVGGERYGDWYNDPLVAFPQHDTHDSASGSAVVCPVAGSDNNSARNLDNNPDRNPDNKDRGTLNGDHLVGLMVGQMFLESVPASGTAQPVHRPAINVATFNLASIYQAIAALKDISVESLHENCSAHIDQALRQHEQLQYEN